MDVETREGWLWPKTDQGAWEWCYIREQTLPEKILQYVTCFDVCIHAGANVGLYAKQYAKHFKRVIAVEPDPTNFYCLVNNVQEPNVIKIQGALGVSHGWCGLTNPDGPTNCGGFTVAQGHAYPFIRIDDFEGEVGLIHLDVEGYESEALKGAQGLLYYQNPIICLETLRPDKDALAKNFIRQFGYEVAEVLPHDTIFRK